MANVVYGFVIGYCGSVYRNKLCINCILCIVILYRSVHTVNFMYNTSINNLRILRTTEPLRGHFFIIIIKKTGCFSDK